MEIGWRGNCAWIVFGVVLLMRGDDVMACKLCGSLVIDISMGSLMEVLGWRV